MELTTYFKVMRVLAGVAVIVTGLLEATYNPGMLDTLNGVTTGLVLYALWRT